MYYSLIFRRCLNKISKVNKCKLLLFTFWTTNKGSFRLHTPLLVVPNDPSISNQPLTMTSNLAYMSFKRPSASMRGSAETRRLTNFLSASMMDVSSVAVSMSLSVPMRRSRNLHCKYDGFGNSFIWNMYAISALNMTRGRIDGYKTCCCSN